MKQLFTLLFLMSMGTFLAAQVTTASINGTLTDNNNEPLIAATVVAIHTPSGTQYGTTTREDGRYNLPNLRVGGPYTVQAAYLGYKDKKYEGVQLSLAQKLTLNFELISDSEVLDEVVITADANSDLNSERTGAATNISSQQLKALPTISRSTADYYRLTPQADGNSFGGRNDQFNNFSLDGSIFNNPFGLDAATPGGQADAQPVSLDAIDQIQVSVAPFDITQAGFTGAAINAVTKSGTNEFSGTVFGFYRNEDMTGSKVSGEDIFVPDLTQFQTGFSFGGPLIKDKLFFFVNAELDRREDLGSNFLAAQNDTLVNTGNISRVLASDLEAVSNALFTRFGYETGAYENFKHKTESNKGIIKLDYNINKDHTLTATYNFLDAFKDKPAHPSAIGRRGPDATTLQFQNSGYRINNKIHSGIVELRSIIGNKASNKLQVGFTAFRDTRDPFSTPVPVININKNDIRYIVAGHEPFSINNKLDQDVWQITNNFNYYAGDHTLTAGFSFERFSFNNSFNLGVYDPFTYGGGTFGPGWNSTQEFVDAVNSGGFDEAYNNGQTVFDANETNGTWALAETNLGQTALYIQDEWAVNSQLTVTAGLRVDIPMYFDTEDKIRENIDTLRNCCYFDFITYFDENGNEVTFDHTILPDNTPLISPRLGFNYDIKGDQTMQLRGGTGLFTGRLPFVWIGNQVANPNFFFYTITHPDFQFPQVWKTNLGYDQKFGDGWIATTDLIYSRDLNAMMVRNYGIAPPSGNLQGVDNRAIYVDSLDRNSFANNAYVFTNVDEGYQFNASFQIKKTWANGLYASLGYNYLLSKDVSSVEAEISSDAYDRNPALGHVNTPNLTHSLYGNQHRVIGSAYKRFEYGGGKLATSVALFFEYAKGGRYSYTYSGDLNSDGSFLNDLIYIPTDGDLEQMTFASGQDATPDEQRAALKAFIEQDDYLKGRRGEYAEKYAILSPWYSEWDIRILQDFNFAVGEKTHTVQFSIDMLNVGNFISSEWGVRQLPVNTQPIGVTVVDGVPTYSFDTSLTETLTDDFSLASRWQLQFGLRYIF